MRILVTGREGQVAQSLAERAAAHPGVEIVAAGRPELDLAQPDTVRRAILDARPDVVVSAAAYTAVDQAEDEPDAAFAVNAAGAGAVAEAARDCGAPVIHLSTDYVFAGDAAGPYREDDPTGPRSVYGRSKLEGERLVVAGNPRHVVLRTAWVYSPFGKNFVRTMLRLAETRDALSVVADQWGNPTGALDIADAVLHVAARIARPDFVAWDVYHFAGAGEANWSGFAREIFKESAARGGPSATVTDIATSDYPTKAARPANSRLDTTRFEAVFGLAPPPWRESLKPVVRRLVA